MSLSNGGAAARDVVLIPCWRRPEFLYHCLDNLTRAEGIESMHVIFRPDHGHDPAIHEVIAGFADRLASYEIDVAVRCPYGKTKQSANLLGGYLLAASRTREHVFMIEEDVMVARDFFRWHYAVHAAEPQLFCSLSTRNHNRAVPLSEDPRFYYLTTLDYCSLGVGFSRAIISRLIAPHIGRPYFQDASGYCARRFAASQVGAGFVEQDGLIRRIQEAEGNRHPIAYPYRPRAFHAGFIGYHRSGRLPGKLSDRIQEVGRVIYNSETMRQVIQKPEHVADSEPVPLETPAWQSLRRLPLETHA
jgi:Glycosyltransferase like family 2